MTLDDLKIEFPSTSLAALTGYIPVEYFLAHEREIREAIKPNRVVYRGPRTGRGQSTKRADARFVVIYGAQGFDYMSILPVDDGVDYPIDENEPFFNLAAA